MAVRRPLDPDASRGRVYSLLGFDSPHLWVVIPARDEAARIATTLRAYLAGLGPSDHLVVVVNGSRDETATVVKDLQQGDRRLQLIVEPAPIGKGGAILRGLELVLDLAPGTDTVAYADADGAVDIVDLQRLAADARPGELVVGSRWLDSSLQGIPQPRLRRIASRTFNRIVRGMLDLDITDTQCAAKAMRVSDIPRLSARITATGFSFDVDLLMAAREAGMDIFEEAIAWSDVEGTSVRLRRAVPGMLSEVASIRRKYRIGRADRVFNLAVLPEPGRPLIDHPIADPVLESRQKYWIVLGLTVLIGCLLVAPLTTFIVLNAVLLGFYLVTNLFKLLLLHRSLDKPREIVVTPTQLEELDRDTLPVYTILVPVYGEAAVLPQLVEGINRIDYPAERLDVKILLEADDYETINAAQALAVPDHFEFLTVPDVGPRGKPRACNHGLTRARGEFLVIFDAEDRPDPDQLLKAVWTFRHSAPELICLQAKLNYFNRRQNLLTRWFTAEYSTWFDLLLPGLYSLDVAIPLGGTSNHFNTQRLRDIGAWDAYNVTEDADLGLRIYSARMKTAVLDSTTYEEANSRPYNWIRQRSRWTKGYLQTYLVHMRHPVRLHRQLGTRAFVVFHLFLGGNVFTLLINPVYWVLTMAWFATHAGVIMSIFPGPVLYAGTLGLFLGNFVFVLAAIGGCIKRRNYEDVKWAVLTPIYWVLMSVAAWKGFLQLFYKPFYWEKTIHGHYLFHEEHGQPGELGALARVAQGVTHLPGLTSAGSAVPGLAMDAGARSQAASGAMMVTPPETGRGHRQQLPGGRLMSVASPQFQVRESPFRSKPRAARWWSVTRARRAIAIAAAPTMTVTIAASLALAATIWAFISGSMPLYGDARAHLNVARHVTDGLTPGLAQLGSVWLPLPHLLMMPLVAVDPLWHSGLAGAIVGGICFVYASVRIYGLTRYWTGSRLAGWAAFALFAGSLNLLYIQTTALTEPLLLALMVGMAYHMARWLREMSHRDLAMAAFFAFCASLTRYDGWILLPTGLAIVVLWTWTHERRSHATQANAIIFGVLSGYGIVLWLLYNLIIFSDPLYFIHSGASAQAQQVALAHSGMLSTKGDLVESLLTYGWAVINVIGLPLLALGGLGIAVLVARGRRDRWASILLLGLLASPVVFNVVSLWTGQSTVRVPQRPPFEMWNLRYGLMALPLAAFGAGALVRRWKAPLAVPAIGIAITAAVLLNLATVPMTLVDGRSGISSATAGKPEAAALYLGSHYSGGRVLADDTTSSPLLYASGLNLREFVTVGFKPYYANAIAEPAANVAWAVTVPGDEVFHDMQDHPERFAAFHLVLIDGDIHLYHRD